MISMLSGYAFPRNRFVPMGNAVLHSHYKWNRWVKRPIVLIRDGRDVMVSAYHHFLINRYADNDPLVDKWRKTLLFNDYQDVQANLAGFIQGFHKHYRVGGQGMTWSGHVSSYLDRQNVCVVKYEDLLSNTRAELHAILSFLNLAVPDKKKIDDVIALNSFHHKSGRKPGQEDKASFLRKGIAGDWKNYFNEESYRIFDELYGDLLIHLGYEKNRNWF